MFRVTIMIIVLLTSLLLPLPSLAKKRGSYIELANKLVEKGHFFTAIPYIKEYLVSGGARKAHRVEDLIDTVITMTGVRQFEVLPIKILRRSNAPVIKYILAKKLFRKKRYREALSNLGASRIPQMHPVKPYALLLEASIYSITKKYGSAVDVFEECIDVSNTHIRRETIPYRVRQLNVNRDNCIVGIPRTQFAMKRFKKANNTYLDLPKKSYVWPEILFEEAWNSFYMGDYNRTLGKLVTYKAPIFDYIFNSEIEILKALTYMHLCLFKDAKKVVANYYDEYERGASKLKNYLRRNGKRYKTYFQLAKDYKNGKETRYKLLNRMLSTIIRDPAYIEQMEGFGRGIMEIDSLRGYDRSYLKREFQNNLKESMKLQVDLVGAYVRKNLYMFLDQIQKGFEGMTYIKLEVLGKKKARLYNERPRKDRSRGNVKNLKRTDKQYFWTFNGEFWADELGDYVFALKSECN